MTLRAKDPEQSHALSNTTVVGALLESIPDAIVVVDRDGLIRQFNHQAERMFGYARDELLGQPVEILISERFESMHHTHRTGYFEKPEVRQMGSGMELLGRKKGGLEFPVEISLSPLPTDDGLLVVSAIRDLTERLRVQQELLHARDAAQAANRAKSEFLSHMSHELRTPLNGVLGYAQILQRDAHTDRQRDNLKGIVQCGEHLLTLINDILDLSKIEAGHLELDPRPCDFHKLLYDIAAIVSQWAQSKGLSFSLRVSPSVPQGIVIDATKLRQVLVNLLGNAVKFTQQGEVTLHITEIPGEKIRLDVSDTGIGIPADQFEDIFNPFKQAEGGKAAGGTGLGLAISQRLVRLMGGDLVVESELGRGSCFSIILPLEEVLEENFSVLEEEDLLTDGQPHVLAPGQNITVLIADDRPSNRDILIQLLEDTGFKTVLAIDGVEALAQLRAHRMPLVLMDVRMPNMNGIEALQRIRQDPELKKTVVIAVTASVFPEFKDYALEIGFDDFIGKPFRASELIRKIVFHLDATLVDPDETIPDTQPEDTAPGALAPEVAAAIGERLREALKIRSLTALNSLAAELAEAPTTTAASQQIQKLVRSFDFDGLAAYANELDQHLG